MSERATSEADYDYLESLLTALCQAGDKVPWERVTTEDGRRTDVVRACVAGMEMRLSRRTFVVGVPGGPVLSEWSSPRDESLPNCSLSCRLASLYWRAVRQVTRGEGALSHLLAEAQALAHAPDEPPAFPPVGGVATVNEGTFKGKKVLVVRKDGNETHPADQTKVVLPVSQLALWLPTAHLTFETHQADEPQVREPQP